MATTSYSGFTAAALGTSIAWSAAHKLVSLLPDSWQEKISGGTGKETQKKYLMYPLGEFLPLVSFDDDYEIVGTNTDLLDEDAILEGDYRYYNTGDSSDDYATMILKVCGSDTYMHIPCINGCPKITMEVEGNQLPLASNATPANTTTRILPKVFEFEFPITYLRVYGVNSMDNDVVDNRSKLEKATDSVKSKWNSINPLGSLNIGNTTLSSNYFRDRNFPTYAQVYELLAQFPTQYGCYLYMGFGEKKIPVNCRIEMRSTDGDTDAVMVNMRLTEKQSFDFDALAVVSTTSSVSGTTQSSNNTSTGASGSDSATSV